MCVFVCWFDVCWFIVAFVFWVSGFVFVGVACVCLGFCFNGCWFVVFCVVMVGFVSVGFVCVCFCVAFL